MIEEKYKGHTIVMYDSIEDLPQVRQHKFQKFLMVDAGIGSDVNAVVKHIDNLLTMNSKGDKAFVHQELLNMRQNIIFIIQNVSPKMMAFAALVHSIDGVVYDDTSDEGLQKVLGVLDKKKFTIRILQMWLDARKKKLSRMSKRYSRTSTTAMN